MSTISAGTTSTTTLVASGDTTGSLVFKTNDTGSGGTTAMTIDTLQNVGIGTSSPNIGGANTDNAILTLKGKASTRNGIFEMGNFGTTGNDQTLGWNRYFDGSTENASIEVARASSTSTAYMKFSTNGGSGNTERMRIDSAGRVTMPYQPAFYARWANDAFNYGSGTTLWDQAVLNVGGHYNTSNGRFTAPVAGVYVFVLQCQHYGGTASGGFQDIQINGGTVNCRYEHASGANYTAASCTLVYYLNAGDYAVCSSSSAVWWSDNSYFCGYLLG